MTKKINIYEAKASFSKLINEVENQGNTIIICRNGKPVAKLISHKCIIDPLKQSPELKGAYFTADPCEGVSQEDWPEANR